MIDPWASAAAPPSQSEPPLPLISESSDSHEAASDSAVPFGDYAPLPLHFPEPPKIVRASEEMIAPQSSELVAPKMDSVAPQVPELPSSPLPPLESRGFTSRAPGRPSGRSLRPVPGAPAPQTPALPKGVAPRRSLPRPPRPDESLVPEASASSSMGFKSKAFSESSLYDTAGGTTVEGDLSDEERAKLFEQMAAKFSGEEFTRELKEDEAAETRSVSIKGASRLLRRPSDFQQPRTPSQRQKVVSQRLAESRRSGRAETARSERLETKGSGRQATGRARRLATARQPSQPHPRKGEAAPSALTWIGVAVAALGLLVGAVLLFDSPDEVRPRVLPQRSYGAPVPTGVAAPSAEAADLSPQAGEEQRRARRGANPLDFASRRRIPLRNPDANPTEVASAVAEAWNLLLIENKLYTAATKVASYGEAGLEAYLDRVVRSRPKAEEAVRALELLSVLDEDVERRGLAALLRRGRGSLASLTAERIGILRGAELLQVLIADFVAAKKRLTTTQREAAIDLMREYGAEDVLGLAPSGPEREVLVSLVISIDPEAVIDDVGDWLGSGDREKRKAALNLMRKSAAPILLEELHLVLKTEGDRDLFLRACRVAAVYRQTATAPILLPLMNRGNVAERQAVVRALQRISGLRDQREGWDAWWQTVEGTYAERESLCAQVRDPSQPVAVRLHTLERLAAINGPATEDLALRLLTTPGQSEEVTRAAIRLVERWEMRGVVPQLALLLEAENRGVRGASERALRRLTGENFGRKTEQWLGYIQRRFGKRGS